MRQKPILKRRTAGFNSKFFLLQDCFPNYDTVYWDQKRQTYMFPKSTKWNITASSRNWVRVSEYIFYYNNRYSKHASQTQNSTNNLWDDIATKCSKGKWNSYIFHNYLHIHFINTYKYLNCITFILNWVGYLVHLRRYFFKYSCIYIYVCLHNVHITGWNDKMVVLEKTTLQLYFKPLLKKSIQVTWLCSRAYNYWWNDKMVVLKKTTLQLYSKTFIEKNQFK